MPFVAPWVRSTDVLGSIQAGSSAGLHARSQDIAEQEAADRLQLQYEQMAKQQAQFQMTQKAHATDAAARLALAASNAALQAGWHKEATEQRKAADALREKRDVWQEDIARKKLETEKPPTSFSAVPVIGPNGETMAFGVPGARGAYHPLTPQKTSVPASASALQSLVTHLDKALEGTALSDEQKANYEFQRKSAQEALTRKLLPDVSPLVPQVTPGKPRSLIGIPLGTSAPKTNFVPASAALSPMSTNSAAATEANAPFKEGQTIRNRKDGRLYKVVDGEPVLIEEH